MVKSNKMNKEFFIGKGFECKNEAERKKVVEFFQYLGFEKNKRADVGLSIGYEYLYIARHMPLINVSAKTREDLEILPLSMIDDYYANTTPTESEFKTILDSISSLLDHKNKNYGNSALEPLNIFAGKSKVGVRLDDKLARVMNCKTLRKNDLCDILGYCVLICKENNWTNFDEFKD